MNQTKLIVLETQRNDGQKHLDKFLELAAETDMAWAATGHTGSIVFCLLQEIALAALTANHPEICKGEDT